MNKKLIVTIDGPAGSGKSTTARLVATKLGYTYIDSGAMYRAVTLFAIENGLNQQFDKLIDALPTLSIRLVSTDGDTQVFLNDIDISASIRTPEVSELVSEISQIHEVRIELLRKQREMGTEGGVVMEGRDIGSAVFPEAEAKFYLVASADRRTERRVLEYKERGIEVSFDEVKENLLKRDYMDSHRATNPLVKPEGAIEIDTSELSIEDQVDLIVKAVNDKSAEGTV